MRAFLDAAIAEARLGLAEGGIPIGAVLVHADRIIGRGHNRRMQQGMPGMPGPMGQETTPSPKKREMAGS